MEPFSIEYSDSEDLDQSAFRPQTCKSKKGSDWPKKMG